MNKFLYTISLSVILLIMQSCSIKEDRSSCPLNYHLHIEKGHEDGDDFFIRIKSGDEVLVSDQTSCHENEVQFTLDRGETNSMVYCGVQNSHTDSEAYIIPLGKECGKLYAWSHSFRTFEDDYHDKAVLHKQFAALHITSTTEKDIMVRGDTHGVNLTDLSPIQGSFEVARHLRGDVIVLVPRQKDDGRGLTISILSDEGIVCNYNIGNMAFNEGYDWSKEDLDDISICIEESDVSMQISVSQWDDNNSWKERI